MSIQKNIFVVIFITVVLILVHTNPGRAIQTDICKLCHGYVKPLPSDGVIKDCMGACHGKSDHGAIPETKDPKFVHNKHYEVGQSGNLLTKNKCKECHKEPECTNCHNTHERGLNLGNSFEKINNGIDSSKLNVLNNGVNISNVSNCINCHGRLPQPTGHTNFRVALAGSKHKWMNCRTCHLNKNDLNGSAFGLHFKDLSVDTIDDSVSLCKICHSFQYQKLKNGEHGNGNKDQKCVDCHNPHTTDFTGAQINIGSKPKEPTNITAEIGSAGDWITEKIPILKNTSILFIIFLIIGMTIAEHMLSKHEEGTSIAYNTIKIQDNEDTLKTLEIKLINRDIGIINDLLEESGINILGMTMKKEETLYKYVIFLNVGRVVDLNVLANKISIMGNVQSANFTDKYDL